MTRLHIEFCEKEEKGGIKEKYLLTVCQRVDKIVI